MYKSKYSGNYVHISIICITDKLLLRNSAIQEHLFIPHVWKVILRGNLQTFSLQCDNYYIDRYRMSFRTLCTIPIRRILHNLPELCTYMVYSCTR